MHRVLCALAATAILAATMDPGHAQSPVRLGTLSCDVSGGIGLIITSKKDLLCIYTPDGGGPPETYGGAIRRFGLDIGATTGGQMIWIVYAPTRGGPNALAGDYAGATAEATLVAGAGANALIGGSNRTVTLQPLSVQAQTGFNLAAGVAELSLRAE